ncbi:MAG: HD domain-containing protein [Chlorobiaceae bacterium]|nr:HD domain-containing protein [Chlorobiaceae bacterium]
MHYVSQPALAADLIEPWRSTIGRDFAAYRNHVFRVCNFCLALADGSGEAEEKIAIAAVYHDLGIWSGRTFDYLPHSIRLAKEYLAEAGHEEWIPEITAMIDEHHKLTGYRKRPEWLVEPFRRADLVDLSLGVARFGLDGKFIREVRVRFPNNGFHRRLLELTWQRINSDPLDPLPMMKW